MKKLAGTATALVMTAGAAYAAGPEPMAPQPMVVVQPESPFWAGPYVGGQLGYAYSEFDLGNISPNDFSNDSVIGGLTLGYLWSAGNGWYLGPEFQYDWADLTVTDPGTGNTASFDEIARLKLIAGRELGNGLLYGSAGVAYANFDGVGTFFDDNDTSYVVGLGYDWRVGENWTVGAEYMYHDFNGVGTTGGDVSLNTLHLKASYRF